MGLGCVLAPVLLSLGAVAPSSVQSVVLQHRQACGLVFMMFPEYACSLLFLLV